jgi:hypothetical protein
VSDKQEINVQSYRQAEQQKTEANLWVCESCRAPNSLSRSTCFRCGVNPQEKSAGVPLPGQTSFPCPNCHAPMVGGANRAESCPSCGRVVASEFLPAPANQDSGIVFVAPEVPPATVQASALDRLTQVPPPVHWGVVPQADGTVVLRRKFKNSWTASANGPAVVLAVTLLCFAGLWRAGLVGSGLFSLLFAGLLICGGTGVLFALFSTETIITGPNLLKYRRELWGWGRTEHLEGAGLLYVFLGQGGQASVVAEFGGGKRLCVESTQSGHSAGNSAKLGAFLQAQTGWPLQTHPM